MFKMKSYCSYCYTECHWDEFHYLLRTCIIGWQCHCVPEYSLSLRLIRIALSGITQQSVAIVEVGADIILFTIETGIISQKWPDMSQCPNVKMIAATNFSKMTVQESLANAKVGARQPCSSKTHFDVK